MGVENYNLQFTLAKAENAQAFQNQQQILDRALMAEMARAQVEKDRTSTETVQTTEEPEQDRIRTDADGKGPGGRRRRRRPKAAPEEPAARRRPGPNGEGSLIDITV